jgi:hypothetical protein
VSEPVRVVGLKTLPVAGDELIVVDSEARAQLVADLRQRTAQLRYLRIHPCTTSSQLLSTTPCYESDHPQLWLVCCC